LDLKATIDDGALTIAIEDNGIPYNPDQYEPDVNPDVPLEQRPIGGLGIYLAKRNVDRFIYERVGERNRNTLIVNRSSDIAR
jgi:anti-sigma regulatory factor (Ser/Thr protein kinase)